MSDMSSDSSDSETENVQQIESNLTLEQVNEMVREYEKETKRERKKRVDAKVQPELEIPLEKLAGLTLTKKQLKQLERDEKVAKKEQTAKQKEALRVLNERKRQIRDLRKEEDKDKPSIVVKAPVVVPRKKREKKQEEVFEMDEEPKPKGKFQAKKPKVEDSDDDIEEKVEKLNKINSVLESNNPYLAMIMASRMRR